MPKGRYLIFDSAKTLLMDVANTPNADVKEYVNEVFTKDTIGSMIVVGPISEADAKKYDEEKKIGKMPKLDSQNNVISEPASEWESKIKGKYPEFFDGG